MGQDDVRPPEGEYTAVVTRPCKYCDQPVEQPATGPNRNRPKEFCDARHRAAYREREHQKALALTIEAIDEIEAGVAKLMGARAILERFQKKTTRTKKKT